MSKLAALQDELKQIQIAMQHIEQTPDDALTDTDIETFSTLSEQKHAVERALGEERARLRQALDLSKEYRPQDVTLEHGTAITAGAMRSYAHLFGPPERSTWKPGEFFRCVANGWHDPRLRPLAAMGEGTGSAGGLMVPEQLASRLLDRALHQSIVMARANISPMTSREKLVAGFAATDQSTTLYGFQFHWLAESQNVTPGSGLIRAILLRAHAGGIYVGASNELVSDSPGFEQELMLRLGDAVAEELDASFISGSGVGMPLGYLRSGALLVIPKETSQPAGSLVAENVLRMLSHATSASTSVWVANPSTVVPLGQLIINVGAETMSATLLNRSGDGSLQLAGRPLLLTHRAPVLGQQGDLSLCDFSSYVVGLRQGVAVESSQAPGFTRNEATFRALVRVDGQPIIHQAFTGDDGRQYSPFVTLAVRA